LQIVADTKNRKDALQIRTVSHRISWGST